MASFLASAACGCCVRRLMATVKDVMVVLMKLRREEGDVADRLLLLATRGCLGVTKPLEAVNMHRRRRDVKLRNDVMVDIV